MSKSRAFVGALAMAFLLAAADAGLPQSAPQPRQVSSTPAAVAKATVSTAGGTGAFSHSPTTVGVPVSPTPALPRPAAAPGGAGGAGGSAGLAGGGNGAGGAGGTACAALLALLTLILLRLARRPAAASVWRSALPEVSPA